MTKTLGDTSFTWIQGCSEWIEEHRRYAPWKVYYVNFMFDALPGSEQQITGQMHKAIRKFYGRFSGQFVHNQRAANEQERMPRFFLFPDKPVWKKYSRACISELKINDGGIHYDGTMLTPVISRFRDRCPIAHIKESQDVYCRYGIRRIHVLPVNDIPGICDYAAKTLKWRRADECDVLILPRSVSELRDNRPVLTGVERQIRDIGSGTNVSAEIAKRMLSMHRPARKEGRR